MHFDVWKMLKYYVAMLPYIGVTLEYVIFSLIIGLLLGGLLLLMRQSKRTLLKGIAVTYVNAVRCIPSVVLLFLIFYGLPMFLRGMFGIEPDSSNRMGYVIVTFTMFEAANSCETFRSALKAVDKGQYEAALSVGMNGFQAARRILFPQALRIAIPNIGNSVMFLLKEGALAYTIGLQDIFGRGVYLSSLTYNTYNIEIYLGMFLIYWPIIMILELVFAKIENALDYDRKGRKKVQLAESNG